MWQVAGSALSGGFGRRANLSELNSESDRSVMSRMKTLLSPEGALERARRHVVAQAVTQPSPPWRPPMPSQAVHANATATESRSVMSPHRMRV